LTGDLADAARNPLVLKMNHYSTEDRIFLVKSYYTSGENITLALRKWSSKHKNRQKPSPKTLEALIAKFERLGTVADDLTGRKERANSVRTPELIEEVREIAATEPSISKRKLAQRIGVSDFTAWKILHDDLKLFPYKIQVGQRLSEAAIEKRKEFAAEVAQLIDSKEIDPDKIIFTDEAHFWLDGYVNRQNFRIWGSQKPELLRTTPLHPQKLTVWCGISASGIIGPYFLNDSVTSEVYHKLIRDEFLPEAKRLGMIEGHYFQQDGAPPHTTRANLSLLRENFENRVIARAYPEMFGDGLAWPPYSPDISPLDFFLWGCVKDRVYARNPKNLRDLEAAIREVILSIPAESCRRTIRSFEMRLRYLIHLEGGHIENIIH